MTPREEGQKLFVVTGAPWKDALLGYLSDDAPADFWGLPDGLEAGDLVLSVLHTTPRTLLCLERVVDPGVRRLQVETVWDWPWLPDVEEWEAVSGVEIPRREGRIRDEDADRLLGALSLIGPQYPAMLDDSATRARVIVDRGLVCGGCDEAIDLTAGPPADQVQVFALTAERGRAAQQVLCAPCNWEAKNACATTVEELKFAVHPACPGCGGKKTRGIMWGMPAGPMGEWIEIGGCCITGNDPVWFCGECRHSWG